MKAHPAAELFPMMDEGRLAELVDSIKTRGLEVPIVRCEDMILDGRNRFKACEAAGVTPVFTTFTGDDPYEYVWALNGQRRDLREDQRTAIRLRVDQAIRDLLLAMEVAALRGRSAKQKLIAKTRVRNEDGTLAATLPSRDGNVVGRSERSDEDRAGAAVSELATRANVSTATAYRVMNVAGKRPDLLEKIASGEMSAVEATRQIKKTEVAKTVGPLPPNKYRLIYADPPWKYNDSRADIGGGDGSFAATAQSDHYPPMSVAELQALGIGALGAEDSVLFCWATFPLLTDALQVIASWGYKYKTAFVWSKGRPNFGHYHNASAELLLVCTRGSCTPDAEKRENQVQTIERTGRHSEKPEDFRAMIDRLYVPPADGRVDRIELFRRGEAPAGWHVWGNEAEKAA